MNELGENSQGKPFQYGLRSLFMFTTIAALWLGLWKAFPDSALLLLGATVAFLPFHWIGRWLIRNRGPRLGIGCMVSGMLIVASPVAVSILENAPAVGKNHAGFVGCILAGLGIIMLPIWFAAIVPLMAERQKQNEEAEAAREASKQTDQLP